MFRDNLRKSACRSLLGCFFLTVLAISCKGPTESRTTLRGLEDGDLSAAGATCTEDPETPAVNARIAELEAQLVRTAEKTESASPAAEAVPEAAAATQQEASETPSEAGLGLGDDAESIRREIAELKAKLDRLQSSCKKTAPKPAEKGAQPSGGECTSATPTTCDNRVETYCDSNTKKLEIRACGNREICDTAAGKCVDADGGDYDPCTNGNKCFGTDTLMLCDGNGKKRRYFCSNGRKCDYQDGEARCIK